MSSEKGDVVSDEAWEDMRTGVGSWSWKVPGGPSKDVSGKDGALSRAWLVGWYHERNECSFFHHPQASHSYMTAVLIANCLFPFTQEFSKKYDEADSILLAMLLCGF